MTRSPSTLPTRSSDPPQSSEYQVQLAHPENKPYDNNDMIMIMSCVQVTGCPCRRSRVRRATSSSPSISSFRRSCLRTPRTCCMTSCQTKHSVHLLMSYHFMLCHYNLMSCHYDVSYHIMSCHYDYDVISCHYVLS